MSINDLPVLSALRTKMQWHQERQRVLAENISNSDTPGFKPRDLVEPKFNPSGASASGPMGSLAMMRTSAGHIAPSGGGGRGYPPGINQCKAMATVSTRSCFGRADSWFIKDRAACRRGEMRSKAKPDAGSRFAVSLR